MSDLKPCPFCGGEAEPFNPFGNADGTWCVLCSECASATGFEQTEAEAIAAWNTRAPIEYEGWFYLPKPRDGIIDYGELEITRTENGCKIKQPVEVIESAIRSWGGELGEYAMKRICEAWNSRNALYQNLEHKTSPSLFTVAKICKVLDLDANKLLGIRR